MSSPALSLKELLELEKTTPEAIEATILGLLQGFGFPVTSWQTASVPRRIIKGISSPLADSFRKGYQVASAGYGRLARGRWLDLWVEDRYNLPRNGASYTIGKLTLVDNGGGPHTVNAGQHIVSTQDGTKTYTVTGSGTIAENGTLVLDIKAEKPGAKYNVPNGSITRLLTSLPTVTVSNDAIAPTDTWITTPGGDVEADADYFARGTSQWGTLAVTTPKQFLEAVVKKAVPTITKVRPEDDNPHGPGSCELVLANAAGPATPAEVAAAQLALDPLRAVGSSTLTAVAAQAYNLTLEGEVRVLSAFLNSAKAKVDENLARLVAEHPLGDVVVYEQLVEEVMSPEGVKKVSFTSPTTDVAIGSLSALTITNKLTWKAV